MLYTAIIAASEVGHALRAATKVVYFLVFKSALDDAKQLGEMALERVPEPAPSTRFGKVVAAAKALVSSWFRDPPHELEIREAIISLHTSMIPICLSGDPFSLMMYLARARWFARGIQSGSSAAIQCFEASVRALLGNYRAADELFDEAEKGARRARDPWALGLMYHTRAHNSLLPSNRYEEGQDALVDAIASFRETGDVSVALLSLLFKAIYGRDRESTNTLLGWIDEGISMAHRNGKEMVLPHFQSVRLAVLARQGHTNLSDRILEVAELAEQSEPFDAVSVVVNGHLATAAHVSGDIPLALKFVEAGHDELAELQGILDVAREIHVATVFAVLDRQHPTRRQLKLQRKSLRALKRAAKTAPRLQVQVDLYALRRAIAARNTKKIQSRAAHLVEGFESHGNLYAAREAHLALARTHRGENIIAASEHERIAYKLGRRLGLVEQNMLSDLSDLDGELLALPFSSDASAAIDDSQFDIPAAGMLDTAVGKKHKAREQQNSVQTVTDAQAETLEAWALGSERHDHTTLGDVLARVRPTVATSVPEAELVAECSAPEAEVPLASGDLEILVINLILTSRDAVGANSKMRLTLEVEDVEGAARPDGSPGAAPGKYLVIELRTLGRGTSVPIIGGFSNCENLVHTLGGVLSASTDRGVAFLQARIRLEVNTDVQAADQAGVVIVVHPDPETREAIRAALEDMGRPVRDFGRGDFQSVYLETAAVLIADSATLSDIAALEPFLTTRIFEIARRGDEVRDASRALLRVPLERSELEVLLELG
ncbi:hypothetical protein [Enhygromyxa salina]|nr:hypothetical protein [Enhygromyxa salina]